MPKSIDKRYLVQPLLFPLFPWEQMTSYLQNHVERVYGQRFRRRIYEIEILNANIMHAMLANDL